MIYDEKPEDFIPDIEVVSCSVEYNGKILLLQYHNNKIHGGAWYNPAGKVNKNDINKIQAIVREIKEETGLSLSEKDLIFHKTFFVSHPDKKYFYHYFGTKLKEKFDIKISAEHQKFIWVTPKKALRLPLVPDEDHCIKFVYGV